MGPTGTNRKVVRGHSTGLQYVFEELPGNDNHWLFDPITGILTFNIRSSVWESMERSGERNLIHYQVYITLKALELQRVPATLRPSVYEFLQKELPTAGVFIASTVTLPPRKAKSEVGKVIKGKK